ncbi:MAG: hypothetical protein WC521_04470 [Bdellovibrionales bacterium]
MFRAFSGKTPFQEKNRKNWAERKNPCSQPQAEHIAKQRAFMSGRESFRKKFSVSMAVRLLPAGYILFICVVFGRCFRHPRANEEKYFP